MKVTGVVKKVFDRVYKGQTYYSIAVDTGGKEDEWHNWGQDKPKLSEGDTVSFMSEKNKRGYMDADVSTLKIDSKGAAPAAKRGGGGWNDPDRQASIMAQSSVDRAITFIGLALDNGALTLGTEKAKPPKKFEALNAAVLEQAQLFYDMAANPGDYFGKDAEEDVADDDDDFDPVHD